MLAINNNIDFIHTIYESLNTLQDKQSKLSNTIKVYFQAISTLATLHKVFSVIKKNIDIVVQTNHLNTINKVENHILDYENLEHSLDDLLEKDDLLKWYMYPVKYLIKEVRYDILHIITSLTGVEAHLRYLSHSSED